MNHNHWIQEQLNKEHQRDLMQIAEQSRLAEIARSGQPAHPQRSLLMKLRAEMSELASNWQTSRDVQATERKLQSQS